MIPSLGFTGDCMEIMFKKPELEDREIFEKYLFACNYRGCERTFANVYLWHRFYHVSWAEVENTLVFLSEDEGERSYTFPMGPGDHRKALEALMEDCESRGVPFQMHCISAEEWEELEQLFPGRFQVEWSRDWSDYVYETEKMIRLSGRKYHGKKNHINQFKAAHPDWSYEPISDENVEDCFQMALDWRRDNGCEDDEEKNEEMCVSLNALRLHKELGLKGGLIRTEGKVVAFTLGAPISRDTFDVMIEKAYAEIRGAYPLINQQFLEHEVSGFTYVNREEDTGEEGLRQAKQSYHPVFMIEKGIVTRKDN